MDEKTLEALKASIEHWRENETGPLEKATVGSLNCALCKLNTDDHDFINCNYCPVCEHTGQEGCDGSPYADAYDSWCLAQRHKNELFERQWRAAARRMREFLESLLPEDETP